MIKLNLYKISVLIHDTSKKIVYILFDCMNVSVYIYIK